MELLAGIIHNRKNLCEETWVSLLANRLAYERVGLLHKLDSPFKPAKRQEAYEYASLAVAERVLALKELCDVRLDREDLRGVVDETLRPPPKQVAKKTPPPPPSGGSRRSSRGGAPPPAAAKAALVPVQRTPDDYRKESLGLDSNGNTYWMLDMWSVGSRRNEEGLNYGTVLFKEGPASEEVVPQAPLKPEEILVPLPKKKKGRNLSAADQCYRRLAAYRIPEPGPCGGWEQVACSVEELEEVGLKLKSTRKASDTDTAAMELDEVGLKLKSTRKASDTDTAAKILDQVIPSLNERFEMIERQRKAQDRASRILGNSWGAELSGRSMRQRKTVSYNTDEYDNQIRRAIRAAETEEPQPRP
eukprot:gene28438-31580_t